MALHPVGPLPASTYWRRRAVLLLAVVVLLLVAHSCLGGGSARPRGRAAPKATTSPRPSASPTVAPVSGGPCADSALKLDTSTDASTYPVGGSPKITLTVTNTGSVPCTRDLGTGAIELLVYSGTERIWSSDDCGQGKAVAMVTLAPGHGKVLSLTWFGKRSAPGCTGTREQAKPGTYRVVARVSTLRVPGAVFHFHA